MADNERRGDDTSLPCSIPIVKALVEEAVQHLIANEGKQGAYPRGWAQAIRTIIDEMESDIMRGVSQRPVRLATTVGKPDNPRVDCANSDILGELNSYNKRRSALAEAFIALDELQGEIQTCRSVIVIHSALFGSVNKNSAMISDLAYLSVLRTEHDILSNLAGQVTDLHDAPDGMGAETAEIRLQEEIDMIVVQLGAIFNTKCKEVELKSTEIDDRALRRMSNGSQRRTEIIRKIEKLLTEKRRVRSEIENHW